MDQRFTNPQVDARGSTPAGDGRALTRRGHATHPAGIGICDAEGRSQPCSRRRCAAPRATPGDATASADAANTGVKLRSSKYAWLRQLQLLVGRHRLPTAVAGAPCLTRHRNHLIATPTRVHTVRRTRPGALRPPEILGATSMTFAVPTSADRGQWKPSSLHPAQGRDMEPRLARRDDTRNPQGPSTPSTRAVSSIEVRALSTIAGRVATVTRCPEEMSNLRRTEVARCRRSRLGWRPPVAPLLGGRPRSPRVARQ